jgi:acyl-[acyl carrier protein]--UDP-N-acetylglucosamine O-acyltransferase
MDNIELEILKECIKSTYNRIQEYENNKTEKNDYYMKEELASFISFVVANKETLIGKDKL